MTHFFCHSFNNNSYVTILSINIFLYSAALVVSFEFRLLFKILTCSHCLAKLHVLDPQAGNRVTCMYKVIIEG